MQDITLCLWTVSPNSIGFFLPARKSDVKQIFLDFKNYIEKLVGRCIKSLQTDNSGEFVALDLVLRLNRIKHRQSCPHGH